MSGKIVTVKLTSGEEFFGKLLNSDDEGLLIEKPVTMTPTQQGMSLVPPALTAEHVDVLFKHTHVLFFSNTREELASAWEENFGNGLAVAKKPGLIVPG